MALVHVSGTDYVNPDDVSHVKGFFGNLRIVVYLRNGMTFERFVREAAIDYHTEPSGKTRETWSRQQEDYFKRIFMNSLHHSEKQREHDYEAVAYFVPCRNRGQAFELEVAKFAKQFHK